MGDDGESLAVLPRNMGMEKPGEKSKRKDPRKFIPEQKGGLLMQNPNEEASPYTFQDSPAYLYKKQMEEKAKRAVELEQKDETRGFLLQVEELGKKHKWEEAFQVLERRTAVPSGLFLVTRAVLRWKFCKYSAAFRDIDEALKSYGSSAKSGPLAAAFSCFARICMGSEVGDKGTCSKEMRELVAAWETAEESSLANHAFGKGLFHPREAERNSAPCQVVEDMEAHDGSYVAASGLRIGYVFIKNQKDASAPLVVHFHGTNETAADYRAPALAAKYRDLPVHLLVVDYRGYGWSGGEPSLATFLRDAEPLAEKLPEIAVQHGLAWPYPSGLILSGRSLGAQVAVHLAARFPGLFRGLVLDSSLATSATGDRLGRAPERSEALDRWRVELEKQSLDVIYPLASELWVLSVLEKIRGYDGQLLLLHGLEDEVVPYEGSESLHAASTSKRKEIVLVEGAGHNNIGHFEAYWTAQRRFALKIQLEDSLPKVGAEVEHLCAVCAEKAVSKCGRCQKVWYCGRAHQAEHWKEHKTTCAGGPPEPKPKVEPEADACLIAAVAADVRTEGDVAALQGCLASLAAQEVALHAVYLSWHAGEQAFSEKAQSAIEEFKSKQQALQLVAVESQRPLSTFEHGKALHDALAQDAPTHAWVVILDIHSLWSSRFMSVIYPALRKAAADARVFAVSCPRHAHAKDAMASPADPSEVEAAIKSDTVVVSDEQDEELHFTDFMVRIKPFRSFFDSTPAGVLPHPLSAHRFCHRLHHAYGKKVQTLVPPEGEWLRWRPAVAVAAPEVGETDRARGRELFEGTRPSPAATGGGAEGAEGSTAEGAAAAPEGAAAAPEGAAAAPEGAAAPVRFADAEEAGRAVARLRRAVERKIVQHAGESLAAKDAKALAMEQMTAFLEETRLDTVVGIQRWAKQTSAEMWETAARQFAVEIVDGQK